jgi:hypothetical protein
MNERRREKMPDVIEELEEVKGKLEEIGGYL